jgi:Zn-dependent alcohol dehydrogenase
MKCRGAVLRGAGKIWDVCQIDLDPVRAGEVLVQMAVAGICHSDDHYATGDGVAGHRLTAIMKPDATVVSGDAASDSAATANCSASS